MNENAVNKVQKAMELAFKVRPIKNGFPYLAKAYKISGMVRMEYFIPSNTAIYIFKSGETAVMASPVKTTFTLPLNLKNWNEEELLKAIEKDKQGGDFADFVESCFDAGVIKWVLDIPNNECVYYGSENRYKEIYPEVEIEL